VRRGSARLERLVGTYLGRYIGRWVAEIADGEILRPTGPELWQGTMAIARQFVTEIGGPRQDRPGVCGRVFI